MCSIKWNSLGQQLKGVIRVEVLLVFQASVAQVVVFAVLALPAVTNEVSRTFVTDGRVELWFLWVDADPIVLFGLGELVDYICVEFLQPGLQVWLDFKRHGVSLEAGFAYHSVNGSLEVSTSDVFNGVTAEDQHVVRAGEVLDGVPPLACTVQDVDTREGRSREEGNQARISVHHALLHLSVPLVIVLVPEQAKVGFSGSFRSQLFSSFGGVAKQVVELFCITFQSNADGF
mmetsp:Transcript_28784/g.40535  ORF Transcript_28784/g.40535 Transcript_28784/m.40535 type:complete len:231 (+) Transcript_28784:3059-3751(+)